MYKNKQGFTILELLVVIAIIGILSAVVLASLGASKEKGSDAGRKVQSQEILKALELYYSDNAVYPAHNSGNHGYLDGIDNSFYTGAGSYIKKLPPEASTHYYYCVSANQRSILLAVNTNQDNGGSNFCSITRSNPSYGCDAWQASNASESCAARF